MQRGKKPLGVGFFFSLGHSTIVFLLSFALALAAKYVARHYQAWHDIGGVIGASVSATFLWIVGILNLIVLIDIEQVHRRANMVLGSTDVLLLLQRGFMNRLLGSRFRNWLTSSWQMYPVGVLFGLGFDTASEVALLAITAGAATATSSSGATLPFWALWRSDPVRGRHVLHGRPTA
jgi:high-affinity nickel-transport protein